MRIDPTAAVAPERLERSIDISAGAVRFNVPQNDLLARAWRRLQFNLDAINNRWNQWVLGYGPERQAQFLQNLGLSIKDWRQPAWVFLVIVGVIVAVIAAWVLIPRRRPSDPVVRIYHTFCRKLARRGLKKADHETAGDFARRVKLQHPELGEQTDRITALYAHLRYAGKGSNKQLLQFKQYVVEFRP